MPFVIRLNQTIFSHSLATKIVRTNQLKISILVGPGRLWLALFENQWECVWVQKSV